MQCWLVVVDVSDQSVGLIFKGRAFKENEVVTDVSGQSVCSIFKDRSVKEDEVVTDVSGQSRFHQGSSS